MIIYFIILNSMIHDSYYYNQSTINEIIIIIIQSENDNKSLNRDIIIQYWNIDELQWISEYSFCYIPICYSLIFPHDKKNWYLFISFINFNLTDNAYLYINLLILWWILLTHWISWMSYIILFIYLFWQLLAVLTTMLFIE